MSIFRTKFKHTDDENGCWGCYELAERAMLKMSESEWQRTLRWVDTGRGPTPQYIAEMRHHHPIPVTP